MGSTSAALVPHLQLHDCCYFNRRTSLPVSRTWRRSRLGFGASQSLLRRRSLSNVVCFAVDDGVRQKEEELGTSVGSAVEDRPGKSRKPKFHKYL